MAIALHQGDLPANFVPGQSVAIDTETLGLNPHRDRLCVVQLSTGDGDAHIVQIPQGGHAAPVLQAVLADTSVLKLFHFARFDMGMLAQAFGIMPAPVYCTKIASKLIRTYTDRHGLKDLCRELIAVELDKEQQSSDWGAPELSREQLSYAAADVLHLHRLKIELDRVLAREGRTALADACFGFLPTRVRLDLGGFADMDVLAH